MQIKIRHINRLTNVLMTLGIVLQVSTAIRLGDVRTLTFEACLSVVWIGLMLTQGYLQRQMDKDKKHSQDIDTDRLTRLSLPEVYEDYLRRKQQAQALYEAEMDTLEKDYKQYLNALEEEALEEDAP